MVFGAWSSVFFACFGLAAEVNSAVEVAPASGSSGLGLGTGSIFGSGGAVVAAVAVADGLMASFLFGGAVPCMLAGSAPSQSSIFGAGAIFVTDISSHER